MALRKIRDALAAPNESGADVIDTVAHILGSLGTDYYPFETPLEAARARLWESQVAHADHVKGLADELRAAAKKAVTLAEKRELRSEEKLYREISRKLLLLLPTEEPAPLKKT
jgi:hypothetical protein